VPSECAGAAQDDIPRRGRRPRAKERPSIRWVAILTYRAEAGPIEIDHHFEKLEELQRLIERGPDWNTIETIVVRLNPERATYPGDTIEAAERR
jgi:hypothetical protein